MGVYACKDNLIFEEMGKDAPSQLFYKGDISLLGSNCLAVVGSRRMTTYGKQVVEKFVGRIASAGITIVSGFMYGVDAMAHKTAVDAGGKTIAVMPCGIDLVHPDYQVKLYDEILESGGLIVSEYEGKMQPALYTYPARNRIVAGISKAALVIEAAEKSGSLITARLAKKFKKKVFAIPGPATSIVSVGTNQLIKDGEAEMVLKASDILEYFEKSPSVIPVKTGIQVQALNLDSRLRGNDNGGGNDTVARILQKLEAEPLELDVLARSLKKSVSELSIAVLQMQLKGQIKNINGKLYLGEAKPLPK